MSDKERKDFDEWRERFINETGFPPNEADAWQARAVLAQQAESPQEPLTDEQLKVEWLGFNDPVDNPISLSDFECVARVIERTLATRWGVKLKGDT